MNKKFKKVISFILTAAMVICAATVSFAADYAESVTGGSHTVTNTPVLVKSGAEAEIILDNAVLHSTLPGVEIESGASVVLVLQGTSKITVDASSEKAGIHVHTGASLTIQGEGTLSVTGGKYSAGIGSAKEEVPGTIRILSGTVNAAGGERGAGIGSGYHTSAGDIVIDGGMIRAIGGWGRRRHRKRLRHERRRRRKGRRLSWREYYNKRRNRLCFRFRCRFFQDRSHESRFS